VPKYAIGQGIISPDMGLGGEGPLTRQIRALSHGEKGPKPKANVLWRPTEQRLGQNDTFRVHILGASALMLARLGPIFGEAVPSMMLRTVE
jgi:hypothetical protein